MRKILIILLATFSVLLFGCGKADDNEISFSWWGTSDRNKATHEAIDLFREKYPDIKVNVRQSPWQGYQTTLYNELERGREADVFQINYNWIYSMYGTESFLDLNELSLDLSNYRSDEHDPLTVDGKLLGLSISETGNIFYLNKTLYTAAGITEIPQTWDELIEAGKQIGAHSNGTKFALGRIDAQQAAMIMFSYLSQMTGKNVIENNKLSFTKEELTQGFYFLDDLRNNNVIIKSLAHDSHNDGPTNPNWQGVDPKYGGVIQWNTSISEYENTLQQGQELISAGMFQQAKGEQLGMYKKVSMAYAVSPRVAKSNQKKENIKKFLEFMTTDPQAVEILGVDRGVPSNKLAYELLKEDVKFTNSLEWVGHNAVQALYDNQASKDINLYIHPYYEHDTFRKAYEQHIQKFLFAEFTAQQAVNAIMASFDKELATVIGS